MHKFIRIAFALLPFAAKAQLSSEEKKFDTYYNTPKIELQQPAIKLVDANRRKAQVFFVSKTFAQTPLILVNGAELCSIIDLDTINPQNIQSIQVIKDPKSLAAYGEKGKNGVLLITLKPTDTLTKEQAQ